MRFSLTALARLAVLGSLIAATVAIATSLAFPEPPVQRRFEPPRFYGINGTAFGPPLSDAVLLDAASGVLSPIDPGPGDVLEYVTCSPWTSNGEFVLTGRLTTRLGANHSREFHGWRLAIGVDLQAPSVVATIGGPTLTGRPCWLPSTPSVLLLPAGDGQLYPFDPSGERRNEDDAGRLGETSTPVRPLSWSCGMPGGSAPMLFDPISPLSSKLRRKVFVAMNESRVDSSGGRYGPARLWWLELDPTAETIVAAGPLSTPTHDRAGVDPHGLQERLANIVTTPEGRHVIGFLRRDRGDRGWRLALAPLRFDPKTAAPIVRREECRDIASDVGATVPPFSPDGRFVYRVYAAGKRIRVERIDVAEALRDVEAPPLLSVRDSGARRGLGPS